MKQTLRFGLVLGRPVLHKISAILLKYATFGNGVFMGKTNLKVYIKSLHYCFEMYCFVLHRPIKIAHHVICM